MHLLYIIFGDNEKNHQQAYFSIYSFLARQSPISAIHIMTDQPRFYKSMDKRVRIIEMNDALLKEWKGQHDFFWRIKIKGIQQLCMAYPGEPVLYMDTDTFLYKDISSLTASVQRGKALMHEREGVLAEIPTKTTRRMADELKGFVVNGIDNINSYAMWNAGVVMTPNTLGGKDIDLALDICDAMCGYIKHHVLVEQFSLAVALEKSYGLEPAGTTIAHYWSTKEEWNAMISAFLLKAYMQDLSEEELLEAFLQLDLGSIPEKRIVKNTAKRLKKWIDQRFPDKKITYLDYAKSKKK